MSYFDYTNLQPYPPMGFTSFFKIIHSNLPMLRLPPRFVKSFGNNLSDVALLKVAKTDQVWSVSLRKTQGEIYFDSGWKEFVEHFSISTGHFLVFRYHGSSQFFVLIFDTSGCEIDCSVSSVTSQYNDRYQRNLVPKEEKDEGDEHGTVLRNGVFQGVESSRIKHPSFTLTLKPSYTRYLPIPGSFSKRYLKGKVENVRLAVSDGRTWDVGLFKDDKDYYKLVRGWRAFQTELNLKAGDVCVFELLEMKAGNLLLKLHF